jgi:hypothetical protein
MSRRNRRLDAAQRTATGVQVGQNGSVCPEIRPRAGDDRTTSGCVQEFNGMGDQRLPAKRQRRLVPAHAAALATGEHAA